MTRDDALDLASCRALLRNGSRTFLAASHLLPRKVRDPACVLYAFCRLADDAVDQEASSTYNKHSAVSRMRARLDAVYAGRPHDFAADRALTRVVQDFAIPRPLLDALLEGFEWDAAGRRYQDLAALQDYAARVAGSVGAMMALIMGVRAPELVARACDLGVAMQFSNIARDVGEDARAGRLYLPVEWLNEAAIDADAWLQKPVFNDALAGVIQRLLDEADVLYQRVHAGVAGLPAACRPGIQVARTLYAEIGRQVERQGLDSVSRRAVVSGKRKAWLSAQALLTTPWAGSSEAPPPLHATRYLIDSIAPIRHQPQATARTAPLLRPLQEWSDRVVWLIDLFARLERRDHVGGMTRSDVRSVVQ